MALPFLDLAISWVNLCASIIDSATVVSWHFWRFWLLSVPWTLLAIWCPHYNFIFWIPLSYWHFSSFQFSLVLQSPWKSNPLAPLHFYTFSPTLCPLFNMVSCYNMDYSTYTPLLDSLLVQICHYSKLLIQCKSSKKHGSREMICYRNSLNRARHWPGQQPSCSYDCKSEYFCFLEKDQFISR